MNEKIRKAFPVTEKYTYLNSAAVGTIPAVAVEAVYSQLKDASENGTVNFNDWVATKNRARESGRADAQSQSRTDRVFAKHIRRFCFGRQRDELADGR